MAESPDPRSIFAQAVEIEEPDGRRRFLDEACAGHDAVRAEVVGLLEALDVTDDFLESPLIASREAVEEVGSVVGPYTLAGMLGEGGMGIVFLAEQSRPVRRQVALKVIKAGMDTRRVIARFEAERQALALMDHPNIARVLDAGATETGRPYFVMELVDGIPITEYCDRHRLTTRDRIDLFLPVCQAIQHAHQKGIIHRDIKPSNVLVTLVDGRPVPKVIDFGIAKAVDQGLSEATLFTEVGAIVGTPEYMSPEQADLGSVDVDTRSDIYSLGVLLYELLTGSTPFDRAVLRRSAYAEMLRLIREHEPPRPSTRLSASSDRLASISAVRGVEPSRLSRLLRGDLDWIVMKALDKDRARRYDSATALSLDLSRHLSGDPVLAGPPSRRYRLGKFARKNRGSLATAAAFVFLLMAATAVLAWQINVTRLALRDSEKSRLETDRARQAAVDATRKEQQSRLDAEMARRAELAYSNLADIRLRRLNEALEEKATALADANAANEEKATALADANAAKERSDEDRAETEAVNQFLLSAFRKADPSQDGRDLKIVDVIDGAIKALGPDYKGSRQSRVALLNSLGDTLRGLGLFDRAVEVFQDVERIVARTHAADDPELIDSRQALAVAYNDAGRPDEAIRIYEPILKRRRKSPGPNHPDTLGTAGLLAVAYHRAGRLSDSIRLMDSTLLARESTLGKDDPDTIWSRHALAIAYYQAGRFTEAIWQHEVALAARSRVFGADHVFTHADRHDLANAYRAVGRVDDAIKLLEVAVEGRAKKLGPDHYYTLMSRDSLAICDRDAGRLDDAIRLFEATLKARESKLTSNHPDILWSLMELAATYRRAGRPEAGTAMLESALKDTEALFGAGHVETAQLRSVLARHLQAIGGFDRCVGLRDANLAILLKARGEDHSETLDARLDRADVDMAARRFDAAESAYRGTLDRCRESLGADHKITIRAESRLLGLHRSRNDLAAAEPLLRSFVERARCQSPGDRNLLGRQLAILGENLLDQRKWAEAEAVLRECRAALESTGSDKKEIFLSQSRLGAALAGQGRFSEAETALVAGYEGLKGHLSGSPGGRAPVDEAGDRVVSLFEAWGRPASAQAWRSKVHPPRALPADVFAR